MKDLVEITCYGKTEIMEREEAKRFYMEGIMCSEGSEQERYTQIFMQLSLGCKKATDEIR